jgi:hypothetical protein
MVFVTDCRINICRTNIKDVKQLTEIDRQNAIGTDDHLNESPQGMERIGQIFSSPGGFSQCILYTIKGEASDGTWHRSILPLGT